MSTSKTYNLGRVVGWSAYEEFLKENPNVDPTKITRNIYTDMITYGVSIRVTLNPNIEWTTYSGEQGDLLKRTIPCPGAEWGTVPIIGLDYEQYILDKDMEKKSLAERAISTIFSAQCSNERGQAVESSSSKGGYLTIYATPNIKETGLTEIKLIIRGLGVEAIDSPNLYLGPQALFTGNNFSKGNGVSVEANRQIPRTQRPTQSLVDAPVIDMQSGNPNTAYNSSSEDALYGTDVIPSDATLRLTNINTESKKLGYLVTYAPKSSNGKLPVGLYGTEVDVPTVKNNPEVNLYPIDVHAPYHPRVFPNTEEDISNSSAIDTVKLLESSQIGATGFMRDEGATDSYVLYELNGSDKVVPVSNDEVVNLNGVKSAYTNLFALDTDDSGNALTIENLQKLKYLRFIDVASGYVSKEFIDTYGIGLNELDTLLPYLREGGIEFISGWYSTLTEEEKSQYVGVVCSPTSHTFTFTTSGSQQLTCLLINKDTGYLSRVTYQSIPVFNHGLDVTIGSTGSGAGRQYNQNLTRFLCSWWNKDRTYTDSYGAALVTDAVFLYEALPQYKSFYTPYSVTVKAPEDKRRPGTLCWDYWFSELTLEEFLNEFETTVENQGIHKDYEKLSMLEFGKKVLQRDISKPDIPSNKTARTRNATGLWLFTRDSLPHQPYSEENPFIMRAAGRMEIPGNTYKLNQPAFWNFYKVTWTLNKQGEYVFSKESDTTVVTNNNSRFYAKGTSGNNTTYALSLTDMTGMLFNLMGTFGEMNVDFISWDSLMDALQSNRLIDLLGLALRQFKSNLIASGPGFIEIKDTTGSPVRLYISKTEPVESESSPIPDGSIGIGW